MGSIHKFHDEIISASTTGDLPRVTVLYKALKRTNADITRLEQVLEAAVKNKQLDVISYLLRQRARVTRPLTLIAVHMQSTEILEVFLAHGWDINHRWFPYTMPTISEAIGLDNLELVKWFLSHGATLDLEPTEFTCRTPLTLAVGCASLEIVKLLIAHGAKVDRGNLLHEIVESNHPGRLDILAYLIRQGADIDQIEEASNYRLFDVKKKVFGIGTALHNAVKHNKLAIAVALLNHGAERCIDDTEGRTPLDWADDLKRKRMIRLLDLDGECALNMMSSALLETRHRSCGRKGK
ncbi:hypothetical protein MMC30_005096 [Trapelia coarctata]|nr:hypothetical protein [Trapelia coarctata]